MTHFADEPDEWDRLDWNILQNSPVALYFRIEVLERDLDWLRSESYHVNWLDCSGWSSSSAMHDGVSSGLEFPSDYGRNLYALNDCLGDLEVPETGGRVIVLRRFDLFWKAQPDLAHTLLDLLAVASRRNLLIDRRLIALAQNDELSLELRDVGACPVMWNPQEWLNKNRGL